MRMRVLPLLLVVGVLLTAVPAGAQEQADIAELPVDEVDTSDHPEVRLTVTAPQSLVGSEVPAEAFSVSENGEPRDVEVSRLAGDDLQVVLVIDTSGSMSAGDAMSATRAAATDFVERMPAPAQVAVAEFNDEPNLLSTLSDDKESHVEAIAGLQAAGETALYDAIETALSVFSTDGDGDAEQVVVVLSDGGDTASEAGVEEVAAQLAESGATLHAIELVTDETDPEALNALVDAGGGALVSADDPDALAGVYETIASTLVDRYSLAYSSETHGATELRVAVDHEGVAAETVREVPLPEAPAEAAAPPAPEGSVIELGWLDNPWALVAGAVLFYAAIALLILVVLAPRSRRSQLAGASRGSGFRRPELTDLTQRATLVAERLLERRGRQRRLNAAMERAGLSLRAGEFVVLVVSGGVVAFAVGLLLANALFGLVLAVMVVVVARIALNILASRRQGRFADQLSDTLQVLAGSLRAGYGLTQALDTVAKEADPPTSQELKRVVVETRLGRDTTDALRATAERMQSDDFDWVVQAMEIHQEVGGDLAEVLDNVAETVRERNHIKGQVKALSAEGRLSAIILVALPFVMAVLMSFANPGYIDELFTSTVGIMMVVTGIVLMTFGAFWLRRIVRIVF